MAKLHTQVKGKAAELHVAAQFLSMGLDVFEPLVDIHGIDLLVRRGNGRVDEVQVKSVSEGRWFQVQSRLRPEETRMPRRWVLCVEADRTTWVFPARVFFDPNVCRVSSKGKSGWYTYDLNLDATRRGNKKKNSKLLAKYEEAWDRLSR